GDQPSGVALRRTVLRPRPSARTTAMSKRSPTSREQAISPPSGDQYGPELPPRTTTRVLPPTLATTSLEPAPTYATRRESGDHDGDAPDEASFCCPLPSAFMTQSWDRFRTKTIRRPPGEKSG